MEEFRQNLRLGLAALGAFVGVAFLLVLLIEAIRGNEEWYNNDDASGVILLGGPILAVIAGVCAWGESRERLRDSGVPARQPPSVAPRQIPGGTRDSCCWSVGYSF